VAPVHGEDEVEVVVVPDRELARPQGAQVVAAPRGPVDRPRVRRIADVPVAEAGGLDPDLWRKTPSAVGERQMLPVQTMRTLTSAMAGKAPGDLLKRTAIVYHRPRHATT
jgi:hypothetical protein